MLIKSAATAWAVSPPSMRSATSLKALAVIVLSTVLTSDTFWAEPTARNSSAVAAVGEGRRRLRSFQDLHVAHALDAHGQVLGLRLVLAAALRVERA